MSFINIKDNNTKELLISFLLMIVGYVILNLSLGGFDFGLIIFTTLFIYLPLFLKISQVQSNIDSGKVVNFLLSCLLILGQVMSVLGCALLTVGVLAALLFKMIGALLAAIPLLISAILYAIVSFKFKNRVANIVTIFAIILLILASIAFFSDQRILKWL
jgi:hypothetical protein